MTGSSIQTNELFTGILKRETEKIVNDSKRVAGWLGWSDKISRNFAFYLKKKKKKKKKKKNWTRNDVDGRDDDDNDDNVDDEEEEEKEKEGEEKGEGKESS